MAMANGTPELLCPWLTREDLDLIGDLGLPDLYHWGNLQTWTERFLQKYHARISDARAIRHRFIRTKCIACKHLCEDADLNTIVDPPVALPCGHIMGWTCYADLCDAYEVGESSPTCPWRGPAPHEPSTWSAACDQRIIYDCDHPDIFARVPSPTEDFYLPQAFFTPAGGYVTTLCRRCSVRELLVQWTQEARQKDENARVFAACDGLHGLEHNARPIAVRLTDPEFVALAGERTLLVEELIGSTPTPLKEEAEPDDMDPTVIYFRQTTD
ncbi:hypothetical protein AK830_g7745 [Neonectria ditissima]|uniref:Uncharacterized protein n=1 Tax=Neonectria ditissima TaxID=78410 RepID=A0A0P7B9H4_9HYPO|nr:hypothetical protein AK830_g7745 [Neonectria ditissima]